RYTYQNLLHLFSTLWHNPLPFLRGVIMSKLQRATCWAQIVAAVASVSALVGVYLQIQSANNASQLATATTMYDSYLKLAMTSSEFSDGYRGNMDDDEDYRKYTWYMSKLLFSVESILALNFGDETTEKEWRETLRGQLNYHKPYLSSCDYLAIQSYHSERLNALIAEVVGR
ncbi:hypothetical protein BBL94_18500, partial [Vibrio parahaemolyticus]